jgi:hypothetical protein
VPGLSGLDGLPLEDDLFASLGGLDLLCGVGLDSVQELLSALGVLDVLNSDVDSLLHVSTVDDLVADDSNTSGRDVVDDTGLSVVDYMSVCVGWWDCREIDTHTCGAYPSAQKRWP